MSDIVDPRATKRDGPGADPPPDPSADTQILGSGAARESGALQGTPPTVVPERPHLQVLGGRSRAADAALPEAGDRYRVEEKLGAGGMGVVYRAHDRVLDRDVALKVLFVREDTGPETIQRFQQEARAAATLDHPNIVRVHDVGVLRDGAPFYTMELLRGRDLSQAVDARAVGPREAVEAVRQVALALDHAHRQGILHRDIKPQNVFLRLDPINNVGAALVAAPRRPAQQVHALLLDFGLAKLTERDVAAEAEGSKGRRSIQTLTHSGEIVGTPAFMAPEQAKGERDVDARLDVYGLGATLYYALTGRPPFQAPTLAALLAALEHKDPESPRRVNGDIDRDLETLCLKCLQKAPKDRYADAAALAEDCRRWLAGEPLLARPVGPLGRLWRRAKRNKAVAVPTTLLLATLIGGGLYAAIRATLHTLAVRSARTRVEKSLVSARRCKRDDEGERERLLHDAQSSAEDLHRLTSPEGGAPELLDQVRSELDVLAGDKAFRQYEQARTQLSAREAELSTEEKRGRDAVSQAEKMSLWQKQEEARVARSLLEARLAEAIADFGNAIESWRGNDPARERLADLYWDRFLDSERRRDANGMETYQDLVLRFGRRKYEALMRGEKSVRVDFWLPSGLSRESLDAYLYVYRPNSLPPVLAPVPYDIEHGRPLSDPHVGRADPLRPYRWDAKPEDDASTVPPPVEEAQRRRINDLMDKGSYAAAAEMMEKLVPTMSRDTTLLFDRALCLARTRDLSREDQRATVQTLIYRAVCQGWKDLDAIEQEPAFSPLSRLPDYQMCAAYLRHELPGRFVVIARVPPGTKAEKAGLREEDVVLAVGDKRVWNTEQFDEAVRTQDPKTPYPMRVWRFSERGQQEKTVSVQGTLDLGLERSQGDITPDDPGTVAEVRWSSMFPLQQRQENRLHLTLDPPQDGRARAHLEITLPIGSYLVSLPPGQGLHPARYLFEVARDVSWDEACDLIAAGGGPPVPPGLKGLSLPEGRLPGEADYWIFIPAGPYRAGGDDQTTDDIPRTGARLRVSSGAGIPDRDVTGLRDRSGFFVARFAVTCESYASYLNDRRWHTRKEAEAHVPRQNSSSHETIPMWSTTPEGVFQPPAHWRRDLAVCGVSHDDAVDFCKWATERWAESSPRGGNRIWEIALPTEDEWEKSARGVDGRTFPWGEGFDPSFCAMKDSRVGDMSIPDPEPVGLFPADEGPWGVRDCAGLIEQWTDTRTGRDGTMRVLKGGACYLPQKSCACGFRTGCRPDFVYDCFGFRVVARRVRH